MILQLLLSMFLTAHTLAGQTTTEMPMKMMEDAASHLMKYGYVDSMGMDDMMAALHDGDMEPLDTAVTRYQKTFSLPVTGKLDTPTMEMMSHPRCGLPDDGMMADSEGRKRRYALHGSKWPKTQLTYYISQWTPDLDPQVVRQEIRRAFDEWSKVTPLTFTELSSNSADITIVFGARSHGDPYPFDGRGGTLAHAYYPSSGGDSHFDDDETWTLNTYQGTNLFQVAVHEFGHALGIRHSNVRGSIMFPAYLGYVPDSKLHQDDINAIQQHYGPPREGGVVPPTTSTTTTTTSTTTTTRRTSRTSRRTSSTTRRTSSTRLVDRTSACYVTAWDAVVTTLDGQTYFFKDEFYYELGDPTPRRIADGWQGLNGKVDAALTMNSGYTLIIQGENFWVYRNRDRYDNAIRRIGSYFGMLASSVDAAWTWGRDRTFYLVKGNQVWRNNNDYRIDASYPRTFSTEFRDAPSQVDAAFKDSRGQTHFLQGQRYYTLDDSTMRVVGGTRSIADDWFGCNGALTGEKNNNEMTNEEEEEMRKEKKNFEDMLTKMDNESNSSSSFYLSLFSIILVVFVRLL